MFSQHMIIALVLLALNCAPSLVQAAAAVTAPGCQNGQSNAGPNGYGFQNNCDHQFCINGWQADVNNCSQYIACSNTTMDCFMKWIQGNNQDNSEDNSEDNNQGNNQGNSQGGSSDFTTYFDCNCNLLSNSDTNFGLQYRANKVYQYCVARSAGPTAGQENSRARRFKRQSQPASGQTYACEKGKVFDCFHHNQTAPRTVARLCCQAATTTAAPTTTTTTTSKPTTTTATPTTTTTTTHAATATATTTTTTSITTAAPVTTPSPATTAASGNTSGNSQSTAVALPCTNQPGPGYTYIGSTFSQYFAGIWLNGDCCYNNPNLPMGKYICQMLNLPDPKFPNWAYCPPNSTVIVQKCKPNAVSCGGSTGPQDSPPC